MKATVGGAEIIHGTLSSDGAGNWTLTGQNFESDGTSASGTISGVYSIISDGSFSSTVTSETPNSTLTGYLSGDKSTDDRAGPIMSVYPVARLRDGYLSGNNNIYVSGSGGKISDEVKSKAMPWIPLLLLDN